MSLNAKLENGKKKDDLADFVSELLNDLENNPGEWENDKLDRFLESLSAFIRDMDGMYKNTERAIPEGVNWKFIGELLMGARIYE